jgi:DNA-binding beta-propeller fold protein YncE
MSGLGRARLGRLLIALGAACTGLLAMATSAVALQPLQEVGSSGTGAGQLNSPNGIAIGADGSLYVSDTGNDRISKFTASGSFIKAWGWDVRPGNVATDFETCTTATGCKVGTAGGGAGQFNAPADIAIDFAGNLHVADFQNDRIDKFKPSGSFVGARGFDTIPGGFAGLEMCTTSCQAGDSGDAAGQLAVPDGVAIDAAGHLWVGDNGNNRISEFNSSGDFVKAFGWDVDPTNGMAGPEVCTTATTCSHAGGSGDAAGRLFSPRGLALRGGRVYVADEQNKRISVWTTAGAFVLSWGGNVRPGGGAGFETCTIATTCQAGTDAGGAGEASFPEDVAFDTAGRANVTEFENNRVSLFTTTPNFVHAFGFNVIPGGATGFELCTTATGCQTGTAGAGFGELNNPDRITTESNGAIWVTDRSNDRVMRFGAGAPAPPPPSPIVPSNEFSFGKVKKNKKQGKAKLPVEVPGAGEVDLAKTKKVKAASRRADGAGEVILPIKPKGKAKKKLNRKGRAKVKANVTFTPDGGDPNTKSKRIRLKKRR